MTIKLKLTRNSSFAYVPSPGTRPVITKVGTDLSPYSNTTQMLANDATTYANAVNYVDSRGFVNTSQLSANLANYTPSANLQLSTLTDVIAVSPSNNATLVYNSANNKYIVKQLDLDGGNF